MQLHGNNLLLKLVSIRILTFIFFWKKEHFYQTFSSVSCMNKFYDVFFNVYTLINKDVMRASDKGIL